MGGQGLNSPTIVDYLPQGFKVVSRQSDVGNIDLFCGKCDVSAITKDNQAE